MSDRKSRAGLGIACLIASVLASPAHAAAPAGAGTTVAARAPQPVDLTLKGRALRVRDAFAILDGAAVTARLDPAVRSRMEKTRKGALAALAGGQRVYGWNQALGPLKHLSVDDQRRFQRHILRSHAAGVGPALPDGVVRLALVMKANQMARGRYGVRPDVAERLLSMVTAGVTPRMPQIGSLGTGDLQPQAAAGLAAIGEVAPARYQGKEGPAAQILVSAGLPATFVLEAGEALPIISGSTVLAARYLDAVRRATVLADEAETAFAIFMEATRGEKSSLDARTHAERHFPEQKQVAARLRRLLKGSRWMTDEGRRRIDNEKDRIQDAVSVRAAPHIMATVRHIMKGARRILSRETRSSTSNPLVFPRKKGRGYEFVMGGNWDGAQIGHSADSLNAGITDLGILSQELSARLLSKKWSYGLPDNLAGGTVGLNSGMVQVQTVAAALIPEMQVRAVPAGTLSRPAKFGQEDHNTMAMASVRNLHDNLDRLEIVLAVQLLMAAQGIDLIAGRMAGLPLGAGTQRLHDMVRRDIEPLDDDRYLTPDLERAISLVREGRVR